MIVLVQLPNYFAVLNLDVKKKNEKKQQKNILQSHQKQNNKKLEMCPKYTDGPTLGTSIKLCKGIAV